MKNLIAATVATLSIATGASADISNPFGKIHLGVGGASFSLGGPGAGINGIHHGPYGPVAIHQNGWSLVPNHVWNPPKPQISLAVHCTFENEGTNKLLIAQTVEDCESVGGSVHESLGR